MFVRTIGTISLGLLLVASAGCTVETAGNGGTAGTMTMPTAGTGAGGVAGSLPGTGGVNAAGAGGVSGVMAIGTGGAAGVMAIGTGGAAGVMAIGTGGAAGDMAMGTGGVAGDMPMGTGGMSADPTQMCIDDAAADGRTGACVDCGCTSCLDKVNGCLDEACAGVVRCGQMAGCKGRDCYCGAGVDAVSCAFFGATGPCMMEIAVAAGVCDASMLNMCASTLSNVTNPTSAMYDPQNPVSRANQVSVCTRGQVADPGVAGIVPATEAIAGMCETQCM